MPPRARPAIACLALLLLVPLLLLPTGNDGRAERLPPDPDADLPAELHLRWVRTLPPPRPAWPDQPKMAFDAAPKPAVIGQTVFVPSTVTDGVTAYDADTGEERWSFTTDGPVRFAPAVWEDRLYVASDDGYLYCLDAARGRPLWQFRGGPSDRKVLGNGRLISTWPARGAPVVADGTVYFAAGVWPFMGIFIHALDARTGEVVWSNDGDGSTYMKQPHQADSFGGVAPQGALAVAGDRLLVPGGRSVPACLDRKTGRLLHYRLADNSKIGGGSNVQPGNGLFLNGGVAFDLATGDQLGTVGEPAIVAGDVLYVAQGTELRAFDLTKARGVKDTTDRKGTTTRKLAWEPRRVTSVPAPRLDVLIRAGSHLYGAGDGQLLAYDLPLREGGSRPSWRAPVDGRVAYLVAGGGHLYVSTREGRLYCYGGEAGELLSPDPSHHSREGARPTADDWPVRAQSILTTTGTNEGYCVAWGVGSGRLIHEIVRQSQLRVIAVEPDEQKVADFRRTMADAGLYGERVSVLHGDCDSAELPPYLATLMVSEDADEAGIDWESGFLRKAFASLRPYGGVACLSIPAARRTAFSEAVSRDTTMAQARVREAGDWTLLTREGPLPGSADWTHENADAANTRVSKDRVVKAPLGLLWFGGSSNEGVLPRHGHGPQPQVQGGRLFIEGVDMMRALDIYTGRPLWETKLPGVGKAYDNLLHQPGANAGGSNYSSTHDGIYVAYGKSVLRLNPATGERQAEFRLPIPPRSKEVPTCDFVTVADNYLIAGTNTLKPEARARGGAVSSSENLVAMDRRTGSVLWTAVARNGFRHNALCIGGGRLYVIDRPSADHLARLQRRGDASAGKPRLVALDLHSGREVWASAADVFGTWLSYSDKYDILVESGRVARDALLDEPRGIRAWQARDGKPLWYRKDYVGPAMIRGDMILKDKSACDLRTGAPVLRVDPLTGESVEWTWARMYGCNTPLASENLLTFRSGAAGYYDLCNDGGTANLGGFRAGCTNNLIVAGGLLTAADYTRTCTCSYQNQASLALVPVPGGEVWTYYGSREVKKPVRRVGIALGAPGNRKADDGTLWLEYPAVGGPSPRVPVSVTPANPEWFRRHESQVQGQGHPWVAASGGRGLRSVAVTLSADAKPRTYTVRLTFVEPEHLGPGERVFDVALQQQTVLRGLDIVRESGGAWHGVVKEFKGVTVAKDLTVALTPTEGSGRGPVLCGIEAVEE
jgi:outer membrane protein assembly factor BamB